MAGDKNRQDRRSVGVSVVALEGPDGMREYLTSAPLSRGGRLWCDRILQGIDRGERTSLRLYAEAMRWVGGQINIAVALVESLGVRDEVELRALVESGKRLEQLRANAACSLDDYRDEAVELLLMVLSQRPEWRLQVLERLGGRLLTDGKENGECATG